MAKKIKAIICPQCGSHRKQNVKDDHYLCGNCDTEYFLDDQNTHVIHHHKTYSPPDNSPKSTSAGNKKVLKPLLLSVVLALLGWWLSDVTNNSNSVSSSIDRIRFSDKDISSYNDSKGAMIFVQFGLYNNKDTARFELLAKYYDAQGTLISKQTFDDSYAYSDEVNFHENSDGTIYAIVNKKDLFKLDAEQGKVEKVNDVFSNFKALKTGVVSIAFDHKSDGINLLSRDGVEFCFIPADSKLFQEKCFYVYRKPHSGTQVTKHLFSFNNLSTVDKVKRLIAFKQRYTVGYFGSASWRIADIIEARQKGDKGKLRDAVKYMKEQQITEVEDFTSDRVYLGYTVVLYSDDNLLVITYHLDNNSNSPQYIQALNPNTAEVIWTTDVSETPAKSLWYPTKAFVNDRYVAIKATTKTLLLDKATGAYQHEISP